MKEEHKKAAIVSLCLVAAFLLIVGGASAETLQLDKNTCTYMPEINKDYCVAEYLVCDPAIDTKLIEMKYTDIKEVDLIITDDDLKSTLPTLDTEVKIELEDANCYKTEIKGYKSPLVTVDHVLCYDEKCHTEFGLWNGSYSYRIAHYGNLSTLSGDTYGYVPIISYINGSKEIYECYVMINQTNRTFAYTYYNDYTDYICVDPNETTALTTLINQGNSTSYFSSNNGSIVAWWPMGNYDDTNCYDIGPDSLDGSKTGATNPDFVDEYIVGGAADYTGVRDEGLTVSNDPALDFATGDSYTSSVWLNPEASVEAYECIYKRTATSTELIIGSSQELQWSYWNESNAKIITKSANSFITYSNDYHVVAVYDSSTGSTKLYSNATDVTSSTTPSSQARSDDGVFGIGYYDAGTTAFKNQMDELKLFRAAWSEDQVKLDFYASQFPFFNGSAEINTTSDSTPAANITGYNYTTRYCENSNYLHVIDKDLGDTGNAVYNEYLVFCQHGCTDESWTNFGNAACEESPIFLYAVTIIFIVVCVGLGMKFL